MKSDTPAAEDLRSRRVLAASTSRTAVSPDPPPDPLGEVHESLSPGSAPVDERRGHARAASSSMRLTERDARVVELVLHTQALTQKQIQIAEFSDGGDSRCQRRLTLLVQRTYLATLPRKTVIEPAVYVLNRRSVEGNRLLRERLGEAEYERQKGRLGALGHLLSVNEMRVRAIRACGDLGWSLRIWQRPEELAPLLKGFSLIPDAYFQVERQVDGQPRTAAYFLELERASKSVEVLRSKLRRYGELYYGGRYEEIFGTRALRVLVVFAADGGASVEARRVEAGVEEARRLGVTNARFASLAKIRALPPVAVLTEPIWREPGGTGEVALVQPPAEGQGREQA